jgi:hypothetical protein
MEKTKIIGGALAAIGVGVAGYFGYKLYQEAKANDTTQTVGAFTDGYADHNSKIASEYWRRQRELQLEQVRLRQMGL